MKRRLKFFMASLMATIVMIGFTILYPFALILDIFKDEWWDGMVEIWVEYKATMDCISEDL